MNYNYTQVFDRMLEQVNKHMEENKIPCVFDYRIKKDKEPLKLYSTEEDKEKREQLKLPLETKKYRKLVVYMHKTDTGERLTVYEYNFVYNDFKSVVDGKYVHKLIEDMLNKIMINYFKAVYYNQ